MSAKYGDQDPSYDEEEVISERYNDKTSSPRSGNSGSAKEIMYNEEEYLAEVGEMNCYCVPTRVYGFKDFMFRSLGWTLLNKEQILGALTGKNRFIIMKSILVTVNVCICHLIIFISYFSFSWYYSDPRGCKWCTHRWR